MKLDLRNPKQGLYVMTRTVKHPKPDGRAARGWNSREGTPEGTEVRVTVWQPAFDPTDWKPEEVEAARKRHEERGPEIDLGVPGRYYRSTDVRVTPWALDHREIHSPADVATLREIVDALELVEDGQGLLDQIDPSCRWEPILAFMLDRGDVTIDVVRAAYEAYRAREEEE